jgi:enamine deaminase RidA (YjgF/YER057c/UK114 family)
MNIETRTIKGKDLKEIFITASPTAGMETKYQAQEIFRAIRDLLTSQNAQILQERAFGTSDALEAVEEVRKKFYGGLDDGVDPAWLRVPEGINGEFSGLQVHAVVGADEMQVLKYDSRPCGRIIRKDGREYLALSGIKAPEAGNAANQARRMLEKSESVLKDAGIDLLAVPRTWMWLGDILKWYDDFNLVRNKFFTERGMLGKNVTTKMPASTGIGIGPNNGAVCAMDLTAVIKPRESLGYLDVGGNQKSAYDYGSAFSRASEVTSPAGRTVFVSGTASIDDAGNTTNLGNAEGQIADTIENVRAVFSQMKCEDKDVVQSMIYCKTAEIEKIFCEKFGDLPWPKITMIADVCRDNLLFEIEATAAVAD